MKNLKNNIVAYFVILIFGLCVFIIYLSHTKNKENKCKFQKIAREIDQTREIIRDMRETIDNLTRQIHNSKNQIQETVKEEIEEEHDY